MLPRPKSVAILLLVLKAESCNKCSIPFLDGQWGYIRIYKTLGRTAWKMARPIARSLPTENNTTQGKFISCSILQPRTCDVWDGVVTMGEFKEMTRVIHLRHVKPRGNWCYNNLTHYVNAWNERIIWTKRPFVNLSQKIPNGFFYIGVNTNS